MRTNEQIVDDILQGMAQPVCDHICGLAAKNLIEEAVIVVMKEERVSRSEAEIFVKEARQSWLDSLY